MQVPLNDTTEFNRDYSGSALWITINSLIILIAVLGNSLTICAILLSKKLSSLIANDFVFNLACSDLLVGLTIPYHMSFYLIDEFGASRTTCLLRFVLIAFACASSIANLFLIAADRYIAIVYPLHYVRFVTHKASVLMRLCIWLVALTVSCVLFSWNEWQPNVRCEVVKVLPNAYMNFMVTPMFIVVWFIMVLFYLRICKEASGHSRRSTHTSNFQTLQVMLVILGCFSICWLPFFVETFYARLSAANESSMSYEISYTLAVSNSCMNPIIYAWKNSSFRKAFILLIKCKSPNIANSNNFITNHVPSKKNSFDKPITDTELANIHMINLNT